jgi:hypothetical protein
VHQAAPTAAGLAGVGSGYGIARKRTTNIVSGRVLHCALLAVEIDSFVTCSKSCAAGSALACSRLQKMFCGAAEAPGSHSTTALEVLHGVCIGILKTTVELCCIVCVLFKYFALPVYSIVAKGLRVRVAAQSAAGFCC